MQKLYCLPTVIILCISIACTKPKKNGPVKVTVHGRIVHKYKQQAMPNMKLAIWRGDITWQWFFPVSGAQLIDSFRSDGNGNYSFTFDYLKDYYDVHIGLAESYVFAPAQNVTKTPDQQINFSIEPPITIKAMIHHYNNNYPPLAMAASASYNYVIASETINTISGDEIYYWKWGYADSLMIGFADKNPKYDDSGFSYRHMHYKPFGPYADTIVIKDTINAAL